MIVVRVVKYNQTYIVERNSLEVYRNQDKDKVDKYLKERSYDNNCEWVKI